MGLLSELKRRNVVRMAVLYVVAAWLVMQVAGVLMDLGGLPAAAGPWILAVLVIGFPIALVFSWFYELTPEGLALEKDVPEGASITHVTGRRMDFIVISLLSAALILFAWHTWQPPSIDDDTITVLPFESIGGPEDDYFSRGVAIELLNLLAQLREFKVRQPPEASILARFSGTQTLSKELGVRWILKGNVRRAENRVRIAAQLIDAHDDGSIAWSNVLDRELTAANLLSIQTEIARSIASALNRSLGAEAEQRLARAPTDNAEAYTAYLIGRDRLKDRKVAQLADAVQQFAHAIELDPNFAAAYSGLTDACALYWTYAGGQAHERCPDDVRNILPLARKAVALDPELGEAWISLGKAIDEVVLLNLLTFPEGPSDPNSDLINEAKAAYEKGLELNPSFSQGYHWYALHLARSARYGGAERYWSDWQKDVWQKVIKHGREVDPLSIPLHYLSYYPVYSKTREENVSHARRIIEIAPDSPRGYSLLSEISWLLFGRADEMIRLSSKAAQLDPGVGEYWLFNAYAYQSLGDYDMALAYFDRAQSLMAADLIDDRALEGKALTLLYAGRDHEAIVIFESLQGGPSFQLAFHPSLDVLVNRDLAAAEPERALARYRQFKPDCIETDLQSSLFESLLGERSFHMAFDPFGPHYPECPLFSFARLLQELGDGELAGELMASEIREAERIRNKYLSGLQYPIGKFTSLRAYAVAGRHEEAVTMLENLVELGWRGYMEKYSWRYFAYYDMTVDAIRDHPRFQAAIAIIEADMARQLARVREMEQRGEIPTLEELNALIASK
jgi:TolB-like protein